MPRLSPALLPSRRAPASRVPSPRRPRRRLAFPFPACPRLRPPGNRLQNLPVPRQPKPRFDGDAADWSLAPDSYAIPHEQLTNDSSRQQKPDAQNLDVRVRVSWVKGLNRLYFLFEASENCGDFSRPDLHNDTFEIVVDGDASGGPLIERPHPHKATLPAADTYFPFHGVHAQDYPIFTRFVGKDWGLAWGSQSWIKAPP